VSTHRTFLNYTVMWKCPLCFSISEMVHEAFETMHICQDLSHRHEDVHLFVYYALAASKHLSENKKDGPIHSLTGKWSNESNLHSTNGQ
jgi:hypothetical protein